MTEKRKLAAILFADIEGYTAMMQAKEAEAMAVLKRFQNVINREVAQQNGELVKSYGDGSLVIFNSTIDAIRCAFAMQIAFRAEPQVPLRIGIHMGEVIKEEGDYFGNGINIASRIESMGVPGGVLFSKDVAKRIQNHPEFQTQSLGNFEFKNVKEPIEVFALTNEGFPIPKKYKLKGKFKSKTSQTLTMILVFLLPVLFLALGGIGWYSQKNKANKAVVKAESGLERVAVLPFANKTNDPELDILGDMASDWITRGLMELEETEVVSPFTVRQHLDAVGILPGKEADKTSFSELTGAQTILNGNYYREQEEIIFHLETTDARFGNLLHSFAILRGNLANKEIMIEDLRETIVGYWAAREEVEQKKFKAPKYDAYQAFLEGRKDSSFDIDPYKGILKAIELDSTFYQARLYFLETNRDEIGFLNAAHLEFLERHKSNFSFYEQKQYEYALGIFEGDYLSAYQSMAQLRKKFPKDFHVNHAAANLAIEGLRNPKLGLSIYDDLPIHDFDPKKVGQQYFWRTANRFHALAQLKAYKEAEDYYASLPEFFRNGYQKLYYYFNLIPQGKGDQVVEMFKTAADNPNTEYNFLAFEAYPLAKYFIKENQSKNAKAILEIFKEVMLNHKEEAPFGALVEVLALGLEERWEKIIKTPIEHLSDFYLFDEVLVYKGLAHIKLDQPSKISEVIAQLDQYYAQNAHRHADDRARAHYGKAVLYANMGDKEKAVQLLKTALEEGIWFMPLNFIFDPNIKFLEGYGPYEELLKPVMVPLTN